MLRQKNLFEKGFWTSLEVPAKDLYIILYSWKPCFITWTQKNQFSHNKNVNSSFSSLFNKQIKWLRQVLTWKPFLLIFLHFPLYRAVRIWATYTISFTIQNLTKKKGTKSIFNFFLSDFPIDFYLHTHDFKISLEFNGESCEIITFTSDEKRLEGCGKGEILIDMFSRSTQGFLLLSARYFHMRNEIYGRNPSRIPIYLQLEFIPQIDLTRKQNRKK